MEYIFNTNRAYYKIAYEVHSYLQLSKKIIPYLNEIMELCVIFMLNEKMIEITTPMNVVHRYMLQHTEIRQPLLNKFPVEKIIVETGLSNEKTLNEILYGCEYVLKEFFELSGNLVRAKKRKRVLKKDLYEAIDNDTELKELMGLIGFCYEKLIEDDVENIVENNFENI